MNYQPHWSAVRPGPTTAAPPSPTLARIRAEGMRRGLYAAAPIGQAPARPTASPRDVPASLPDAEARWATDPVLRSEFRNDKGRWLSFCHATAAGRVRISKHATISGGR